MLLEDIRILNLGDNKMNMTTTIEKLQLLEILQKNRDNHVELYKEALEGSIVETKKRLEEKLDLINKGTIESLTVSFTPPQNHEKTYNQAIKMVSLNVNNTIELDAATFNNLVLDDWAWSSAWFTRNSSYSSNISGCAVDRGYLS